MNIHLETSEAKRRQCEEDLNELRTSFAALKEDQEIQEGNYKAQLSTISEHLANMNEKLIQQTEEIQQLKFELGNKVSFFNFGGKNSLVSTDFRLVFH